MSNFAIEGLISGFDTTSLINAILDVQFRGPVAQIESRIEDETEKLTSIQAVNANLINLEIATSSLGADSLFENKTATSSNTAIVTASASSSASVGNFNITVNNLAKADQVSSDVFSSNTDALNYSGKFIVNGKTISVSTDDSLTTVATQINAANAGVKASVVKQAANQYKLVVGATSTGVSQIEMREVGTADILSNLGLITSSTTDLTYDRTVNANNQGALGDKFAPGYTRTFTGETFTIGDAGGQFNISVTLNAANMTLQDIADEINTASTAASANITASVITDAGDERLLITSTTGIPQEFTDPDDVLFDLGVLDGIQSTAFTSTSETVGSLLDLGTTNTSTVQLEDGDGSDSFSVNIDLDSDSLQDIVDNINTQAGLAGSDVTAQVITASGLSRIELNSATGRVGILADPENVLQTLGLADRVFKNQDQSGENSEITFNGITVNRTSNLITDLVEGVSLALVNESTELVNVSINEDLSNVSTTVQSFVDGFNALANFLSEQTFFDAQGGDHGTLFGNSTIRDLEGALAGGISRNIPNLPGIKVSDLNGGSGIDLGSIQITDRSGSSATVDLSSVQTVQDVIDVINSTDGIDVKAEISSSGIAINLVDESGSSGEFKVEEVSGGTTASDLGLLKSIFSNNIAGSPIHTGGSQSLANIGVSLSAAGTLTFDSNELQTALNNDSDQVKNLLQATGVGFVDEFQRILKDFTAFNDGRMDTASKAIQDKIDLFNDQIDRYNDRADTMEKTLRKRFTNLEVSLAQSQQLSDLIAQRLTGNSGQ